MMSRPKVGIALSAGAARGFAHLGVLKVLQESKIPIDYIAGSSIGSFIGALYSNGLDLEMVKHLAMHLKRKHWVDVTLPGLGFISGDKMQALTKLLTHHKNLEDLPIPLAVVTTDLLTGKKVVFQKGPIADAVRASISVPGVFQPVPYQDKLLVDGGVADRLPISVVRDMGADFIIAVDVLSQSHEVQVNNIFDVINQAITIMERQILEQQELTADFLVSPEVGDIAPTAFHRVEECIRRGEQAIRPNLAVLLDKLAHWQGENKHE
ncbi:patatin-like phospholipase family protein [Shimazuella alba]|jgi:NTE family protein|uniref:Patatin family protein n=1 Tax=Shimazuella alba TaxID=2690964 RepID=A0A6I4VSQ6_9BACL|nr:patatin-like phospholipase family protein [Shimazuella alba]MXQ53245.1 patatin family protein [Shimazuella alba]